MLRLVPTPKAKASEILTTNSLPPRAAWGSRILRSIPARLPGKSRFSRWLLGNSTKTEDVTLTLSDGKQLLLPSISETIGFYILTDGKYEADTVAYLKKKLSPASVFVDVGANVGYFPVLFANQAKTVMAIEASPNILPYLRHNIALNRLTNIVVKDLAAYHRNQMVPLYLPPKFKFGMASIAPQFPNPPVYVQAKCLDQMLEDEGITEVDMIKIDVEGYEGQVLKGASQLLRGPKPPIILFEYLAWTQKRVEDEGEGLSPIDLLRKEGFQIWDLSAALREKAPLTADQIPTETMLVAIKK